ncbi:MAG: helix-turn-helix transcriptional regulator [Clostridia bacterium]|nr:helix-turn-helix transcriptional regulator [Clostridia bacterium]
MSIGERIKYYREKKGVTQGALAEALSVTPQAVSKWETGAAYPDILTVPALADYFDVSCDALLTDGGKTEAEAVEELLNEASDCELTPDGLRERIALLENALDRYPRSYRLMVTLAQAYSMSVNSPDYRAKGWHDRILALCERVYAHSSVPQERNAAIALLCYTYDGKNSARIEALANEMPEIHQSRPALRFYACQGAEKGEAMHRYFTELLNTAEAMLCVLGNNYEAAAPHFEALRALAANRSLWHATYQKTPE